MVNIGAYGFKIFKFSFEFLTAVQSSYPLNAKHTLNTVCGLQRSYPHSFSAVHALNTEASHHFMLGPLGLRFAKVRSAGASPFPDFFILIILRQPIGKKILLSMHGVRIGSLAET